MTRVLALAALVCSALVVQVGGAGATNECRGLMTCVPVAGPWIVVPTSQQVPRPEAQYQLTCPKKYVVAGIDAELTDQAIDLWFLGQSGAPVAPGTTTSRTIVFVATYVGTGRTPPTFRPHIGCIPSSGGGGVRTRTAVTKVNPPGHPTIRRVRTFRVSSKHAYFVKCRADERLIAGYASPAFGTAKPPAASLVSSLTVQPALSRGRVTVAIHSTSGRGMVQIGAVCAGGK